MTEEIARIDQVQGSGKDQLQLEFMIDSLEPFGGELDRHGPNAACTVCDFCHAANIHSRLQTGSLPTEESRVQVSEG